MINFTNYTRAFPAVICQKVCCKKALYMYSDIFIIRLHIDLG